MRPICIVAFCAPRSRIARCARSGARRLLPAGPPGPRISRRSSPAPRPEPMPEHPHIKRADESRVDKPWGYEIRWAVTDRYLGKILHVNKGEALSLQYHEHKDEWLLVSTGTIDIEIGRLDGELETVRMRAGDSVHMPPLTRHRLTAVDD